MFEPQRLHPAAILEELFKKGRRLLEALLPMVIILLGRAETRPWVIPLLAIAIVLFSIYIVLYWSRYVFYIAGNELRLEYGVVIRKKRCVPRERIQGIQITSGIVQRWFGLVRLEVETAAGANQAEISLAALSQQQAAQLTELLQPASWNTDGTAPVPEPEQERHLSPSALLIAAATSNGIGVILALVFALLSQIDQLLPGLDVYARIGHYFMQAPGWSGWFIILLVLAAILIAWLLSALGTLLTISGFTLQRTSPRLTIHYGLLEKKQLSVPVKRIQALSVIEGLLRQPFHLGHITLTTAGHSGKGAAANLLFPLLRRRDFLALLQEFLPELTPADLKVKGLPRAAVYYYFFRTTGPLLLAAIPLILYLKPGYLLAAPMLLLSVLLSYFRYRDAGWQVYGDKLMIRARSLGVSTSIIPRRRIQSLSFTQSWLQARRNLGSLLISTASGAGGSSFKVAGISRADADYIIHWLRG